MIRTTGAISAMLATITLVAAYALTALWIPAGLILLLSLPWVIGWRTRVTWMAPFTTGMYVTAAAVGGWLDLNPWLLVIGFTAALSAWDLDAFARQLEDVDAVEEERVLKGRHLRRLLVVDGLGLLSAAVALAVRVNLSFTLALALALIVLVGVSRAISFVRRESA